MNNFLKPIGLAAAAAALFLGAASADDTANADLWALMEPACNAHGIDPGPCQCIMNAVVAAHGVDAATFVAMDMSLMYDQAEALKTQIGEDQAMNASITFDEAQNGVCSNAPAPSQDTGPASVSGAAEGADSPQ